MITKGLIKRTARILYIRGIVQGVGFRPFVYSQAINNNITGWVRNTSAGVELHIEGENSNIDIFLQSFKTNLPPLARIDKFEIHNTPLIGYSSFEITKSQSLIDDFIPIPPDISICDDCKNELFDPANRRYRYPFINCTNCGPRFSIIKNIPYDRPLTTMAEFSMCPECQKEYENPLDRRFHAQPIACSKCGPHLKFVTSNFTIDNDDDALITTRKWIKDGKIIAVKGLGGVHLVCDALNTEAVIRLRNRKKRNDKPFAVMAYDIEVISHYCSINCVESNLLQSFQHPIVLLNRIGSQSLVDSIAPNQNTYGFMLPYTPLHLLLMQPEVGFPEVLVMTSGNISEEPIAYQDEDLVNHLSSLADAFLIHDRKIHTRLDDSVVRRNEDNTSIIRRSRGYVPDTISLSQNTPNILGTGAELKNTFCLTRDNYAFISHHIGDMGNYETYISFEDGIKHFENLFRVKTELLACDLHPDYLTSRYAANRSLEQNIPLVKVQHHHAHLAACLADNKWSTDEPVIGLCFDGTGLGTDNNIWGGEVLLGGYKSFQRMYHLAYIPLPGGDTSIHKTARVALSYLKANNIAWDQDIPCVSAIESIERTVINQQIDHQINSPFSSSMGRLFDAVASLIGIRHETNYEGQAAIELENLADPTELGYYEFTIQEDTIHSDILLNGMITDYRNNVPIQKLSARFHNSLVELSLAICTSIIKSTNVNNIALSGGVWQNRFLFQHLTKRLKENDFNVLVHHQVPCNDGCISLGQVMVAAKTQE